MYGGDMNTEIRDRLIGIKKAAIDAHIKCQDLSNILAGGNSKLMTAKGQVYLCVDDDMTAGEIFRRTPIIEQVCDVIVEALGDGRFRLVKNRDNKIPAESCFDESDLRMLLPQWWK